MSTVIDFNIAGFRKAEIRNQDGKLIAYSNLMDVFCLVDKKLYDTGFYTDDMVKDILINAINIKVEESVGVQYEHNGSLNIIKEVCGNEYKFTGKVCVNI
jgi:hypothetical protein